RWNKKDIENILTLLNESRNKLIVHKFKGQIPDEEKSFDYPANLNLDEDNSVRLDDPIFISDEINNVGNLDSALKNYLMMEMIHHTSDHLNNIYEKGKDITENLTRLEASYSKNNQNSFFDYGNTNFNDEHMHNQIPDKARNLPIDEIETKSSHNIRKSNLSELRNSNLSGNEIVHTNEESSLNNNLKFIHNTSLIREENFAAIMKNTKSPVTDKNQLQDFQKNVPIEIKNEESSAAGDLGLENYEFPTSSPTSQTQIEDNNAHLNNIQPKVLRDSNEELESYNEITHLNDLSKIEEDEDNTHKTDQTQNINMKILHRKKGIESKYREILSPNIHKTTYQNHYLDSLEELRHSNDFTNQENKSSYLSDDNLNPLPHESKLIPNLNNNLKDKVVKQENYPPSSPYYYATSVEKHKTQDSPYQNYPVSSYYVVDSIPVSGKDSPVKYESETPVHNSIVHNHELEPVDTKFFIKRTGTSRQICFNLIILHNLSVLDDNYNRDHSLCMPFPASGLQNPQEKGACKRPSDRS
ncbi:hypothetical protein L9F63_019229, partial [Diploptera punctata]